MSFSGKTFFIHETLPNIANIANTIALNGGIVSPTFTQQVTYLIVSNDTPTIENAVKWGTLVVDEEWLNKHLLFGGMVISLTGSLSHTKSDYIKFIQERGGIYHPTVTKKVTHLVAAEPNGASGKLEKARKNGIFVVGENFLLHPFSGVVEFPAPNSKRKIRNDKQSPKLTGKIIALAGRLSKPSKDISKIIASHGGTYSATVTQRVTHLVTSDINGTSDKMKKAKENGVIIVTEDFLTSLGDPPAGFVPIASHKRVKTTKSKKSQPVQGQTLPTITKMASPPEVLLAQKHEPKHGSPVGWWVSEKLDGVRGWWDGTQFWSRAGNVFYAPDWFRAQMPSNHILDGELFIGRNKFRETISIVKSHSMSERWKEITFMAFDVPSQGDRPFEERLKILSDICSGNTSPNLKMVEHRVLTENDNIDQLLKDVEALGAEGLMLRQAGSKYIGKRSNTLLKIKSFFDDEAKVIGYATKGKGRLAGMTGSLQLEDRKGVIFDCGSGMNDETRMNPPPIGSIVTFRYQEKSAKSGRPRFPVFVGLAIDKQFP